MLCRHFLFRLSCPLTLFSFLTLRHMLHGVSADTPRSVHADPESDGHRELGDAPGSRRGAEASCTSSQAHHESRRSEGADDSDMSGLRGGSPDDFDTRELFGPDDPDTACVFDTRELFGTDDPDTIERELFGSEDPDDRAELDELSLFDDEDGELDGHALLGDECAVADGLSDGQVSGEHLHAMSVGVGEGGASARRLVFDARVKEEDPGLWPCVG